MITVGSLVLEVTRKCNMACPHCLRGEAQNMDMSTEIIDELLKHVRGIATVTFTGGEPSLNLPLIHYFFEKAKEEGIYVGAFWLATNGKEHQEELAFELLKRWPEMEERELCGVALSQDIYHDDVYGEDSILRGLSFYDAGKESKNDDADRIIPEGRAANWGQSRYYPKASFCVDNDEIEMLYISANGKLLGGCDFSYEHIDELSEYDVWHLEDIVKDADAA